MNDKLFASTPRNLEVIVGVACGICALFFAGLLVFVALFAKHFFTSVVVALTAFALLSWFFSLMALRLLTFKATNLHKPLLPTAGLYFGALIFGIQPIIALLSRDLTILLHSWFSVVASLACIALARRRSRAQSETTTYIPPPIHPE